MNKLGTQSKNYSVMVAVTAAGAGILSAMFVIIYNLKSLELILLCVLTIPWLAYFIWFSKQCIYVPVRRSTIIMLVIYSMLQLVIVCFTLLLVIGGGINLSCRDCQGAGGVIALVFLVMSVIGLATLSVQILAFRRLRHDRRNSLISP